MPQAVLKPPGRRAENNGMRTLVLVLALAAMPAASLAAPAPPRGDDHFRLGMFRSEVDSAVSARGLRVISNGTAFLVCTGSDSTVEYEMYSFFRPPHGDDMLWKVTLGYRTDATLADYGDAHDALKRLLGAPDEDTWHGVPPRDDSRPLVTAQQTVWNDGTTLVQLGARWDDPPDPNTDRMKVVWIDRRLQRLIIARLKNEKVANN